jgi:hypothetical protein
MFAKTLISEQVAAGWLLILSGLIFSVGGMLYTGRAMWKWSVAGTPAYLRWERGFVIAALLTAVLGFTLLEKELEAAGDRMLAPSGIVLLLIGAGVVIFAETFFISRQEWVYAPIVAFVVLAFLPSRRTFASMGRLGDHPLEPGLVGHSAHCQAQRYVLSLAPLCSAAPDRNCTAIKRVGFEYRI